MSRTGKAVALIIAVIISAEFLVTLPNLHRFGALIAVDLLVLATGGPIRRRRS